MLEKLLLARSFGGSIDRLVYYHAILLISSNKFDLLFVIWSATPTFLGCWALDALPSSLIDSNVSLR